MFRLIDGYKLPMQRCDSLFYFTYMGSEEPCFDLNGLLHRGMSRLVAYKFVFSFEELSLNPTLVPMSSGLMVAVGEACDRAMSEE